MTTEHALRFDDLLALVGIQDAQNQHLNDLIVARVQPALDAAAAELDRVVVAKNRYASDVADLRAELENSHGDGTCVSVDALDAARAEAFREAAAAIRLGLDTSNHIGKGAEMACKQLDAMADSTAPPRAEAGVPVAELEALIDECASSSCIHLDDMYGRLRALTTRALGQGGEG